MSINASPDFGGGVGVNVRDLRPGDRVENVGMGGVFFAQTQHPIWPNLQLVVWRMDDGEWSHDALSADQFVGQRINAPNQGNRQRLQACIGPDNATKRRERKTGVHNEGDTE